MPNVTINHAGGIILDTLKSLAVDASGNVILNINGSIGSSSGSGTGGSTPVDTPVTPVAPTNVIKMELGQKQAGSVPKGGIQHFYFRLANDVGRVVIQLTTDDWTGNCNLIASTVQQPVCGNIVGNTGDGSNGFYYNITDDSNEIIYIMKPFQAGTTFYVSVCGEGNYRVFYNAY